MELKNKSDPSVPGLEDYLYEQNRDRYMGQAEVAEVGQ